MNATLSTDGQGKSSKKMFKGMTKLFKKKPSLQSNSQSVEEDDLNELQTLRTIDQRSISECDGLSTDFLSFFEEAERTINFTRKTTTTKHAKFNPLAMSDKINQWRAKRKGNELQDSYTALLSRAETVETHLKNMTDHSLIDASTLLLQAVSLKMRLYSCIQHNKDGIERHKPFIEALETLVFNLENSRSDLKDMVRFLDEVSFLRDSVDAPFIPWALRSTAPPEVPFKREILEKRLKRVETALEKVEKIYKGCRPVYEKFQKDLNHCQKCLAALENLQSKIESHVSLMSELDTADKEERETPINTAIKKRLGNSPHSSPSAAGELYRKNENDDSNGEASSYVQRKEKQQEDDEGNDEVVENVTADAATATNTANLDEPQISPRTPRSPRTSSQSKLMSPEELFAAALEPFDHVHCSDCELTCLMANDCAMNLAAAQHLAHEGTSRLQKLFEMREKARVKAHELDSMDWGEASK